MPAPDAGSRSLLPLTGWVAGGSRFCLVRVYLLDTHLVSGTQVFKEKGYEVTIASIKGGECQGMAQHQLRRG